MTSSSPESAVKYDILSPAFVSDPHPTLHSMREQDPVYWHPLLHSWVLTRYADVVRVLRDDGSHFSARRVEQYGVGAPESVQGKLRVCNEFIARWFAFVDPPEHTRLRSLITRAFNVQSIDRLRPRIAAIVDEVLTTCRERGEIELVADLAEPLPRVVFCELIGIPVEDLQVLDGHAGMIMGLLGAGLATAEVVEGSHAGVVALDDYFKRQIARRRGNPSDDLLSRLMETRVDDRGLSDDELVGICVTMMLGDHDTTTKLIANAAMTLIRLPDAAQRLREQPARIDGVIEEVMRYESPSFATFRRVVVDDEEFDGVKIKAGDFVLNVLCAANRDPRRFPEPDRFVLERPDNRHLSFSGGAHTCPGALLARVAARAAIAGLFTRFSEVSLASDSLEWVPNLMLRGPRAVPLRLSV
jgi:pimeloyl-[acyl-carrier protein] synthase